MKIANLPKMCIRYNHGQSIVYKYTKLDKIGFSKGILELLILFNFVAQLSKCLS